MNSENKNNNTIDFKSEYSTLNFLISSMYV